MRRLLIDMEEEETPALEMAAAAYIAMAAGALGVLGRRAADEDALSAAARCLIGGEILMSVMETILPDRLRHERADAETEQ